MYLLPKMNFFFSHFKQVLWSLYSRMCTEHGFARIIIIYVFNKEWQCFKIFENLLKMADILFVTMETGGLPDKCSIYFLISNTHSILLAKKIARFAQIKKSYLPAVCGLKLLNMCFHYILIALHIYYPQS